MQVNIDNLSVKYDDCGEGSPVLLLHGWGASLEAMRPVSDAIVKLGMRAISLDFPGFGGSEAPHEVWGVAEYANFVRTFMHTLNLEGADVLCHSFGGRVVIFLASEDGALFKRIVLVNAAGIRPKRGLKWYVRTYAYKAGKRMSRIKFLDRLLNLSGRITKAGSADYRALQTELMRGIFVKVINQDLTNRLNRITNPTLLIWGAQDQETPLYMGQTMERLIPDSGLVILEGAGHFSYLDQYPRFCAILEAFFKA